MNIETIRPLGYTAPVKILKHLALQGDEGDWLNNIARETEMAISTTSETLERLVNLGWVTSEYIKTKRYYYIAEPRGFSDVFVKPIAELTNHIDLME